MTGKTLTRVMLVDDHSIMWDLLRDALENTGTWQGWRWDRPGGWRVVGASSGPVVGEGILA